MVMDNIQYDPRQILKGFTMDGLRELARKLKRKIRPTKTEIIQEILAHPRGKPEHMVKVLARNQPVTKKRNRSLLGGDIHLVFC